MKYEEFVGYVQTKIEEKLGEEVRVELHQVIKNNSVELELPTGLYQVQFYNTWTGNFDAPQKMENKNGRLRIAIPDFHRDIAAKIIRLN